MLEFVSKFENEPLDEVATLFRSSDFMFAVHGAFLKTFANTGGASVPRIEVAEKGKRILCKLRWSQLRHDELLHVRGMRGA